VAQGYWHAALGSVATARVDLVEDRTRSGEGQPDGSRRAPSSPRTPVAIPGRGEQAAERDHHDAGDRPPSTAGHEPAADQSQRPGRERGRRRGLRIRRARSLFAL